MDIAEKTCNEFLNEMRDAGFDFLFTATSGDIVIKGECRKDPITKELAIKSKRQLSAQQLKERITQRLEA